MIVALPWPPTELNPNKRVHWATLAKRKREYRQVCLSLTLRAKIPAGSKPTHIEFVPPDRRARDEDNMIASFKSGRDGIADALGVDDNGFRPSYSVAESIGGMVRVSFT